MIPNDAKLLENPNSNDELFLKYVINSYTKILYNFIRRFGFNNEESEDLLQNIFIKIWKHIDNFDEEKSSLKTWIFTIAKNTIYDALRKKRGAKIITSLDEQDNNGHVSELEDIHSDVLELLKRAHNKEIILNAIDSLNEDEKTIILLHFEESLTFKEIGGIFKSSINTIKSKYRRSLLKLKTVLEGVHQNIN